MPELNYTIRGIMTTNYVLDNDELPHANITLICNEEKIRMNLIPQEHICFSDPFLDITFIELNNPEFNLLSYINYGKLNIISKDVFIINDLKEIKISKGIITEKYGFNLYHDISLDDDYSGSALVSIPNNTIMGIYSNRKVNKEGKQLNIAINMEKAFEAIQIVINNFLNDKSAFIKKGNGFIPKQVKNLTDTELLVLRNKGLRVSSIPEIFISLGDWLVTDLWFYRTNHAWYWTPTQPNKNNIDNSNWLIICSGCSLKVIGSEWDGDEPADKNINVIHWLASTGFDFLVETNN